MFKSCCARPNKKVNKSKSTTEKMDLLKETSPEKAEQKDAEPVLCKSNGAAGDKSSESVPQAAPGQTETDDEKVETSTSLEENLSPIDDTSVEESDIIEKPDEPAEDDNLNMLISRGDLTKKRYSVEFKRPPRLSFKRFSVDCRQDSATLEELERLEVELARTNVDVRPFVRRKSTGILKSTTSSNEVCEASAREECLSDDENVFEESGVAVEGEGPREPPATPVGRDELALRRHRFFSELVCAARAAVEHRVRFDPLGPVVADPGEVDLPRLNMSIKAINFRKISSSRSFSVTRLIATLFSLLDLTFCIQ